MNFIGYKLINNEYNKKCECCKQCPNYIYVDDSVYSIKNYCHQCLEYDCYGKQSCIYDNKK